MCQNYSVRFRKRYLIKPPIIICCSCHYRPLLVLHRHIQVHFLCPGEPNHHPHVLPSKTGKTALQSDICTCFLIRRYGNSFLRVVHRKQLLQLKDDCGLVDVKEQSVGIIMVDLLIKPLQILWTLFIRPLEGFVPYT